MIVVDANLLIYSHNEAAPQHDSARAWLRGVLSGSHAVGLPWVVIQAFLRIMTTTHMLPTPLPMPTAISVVDDWFASPVVDTIEPGPRHWEILRRLIINANVRGGMVTDAHIAALAIEHDATLYTADSDFRRRFPEVRVVNPLR
ncbi:MAG TPA: TA system VapC family ribonuclease toxin [Thermoanaerobaculia bacterium]